MKSEYEYGAQMIRDAFAGVTLGRGVGVERGNMKTELTDKAKSLNR